MYKKNLFFLSLLLLTACGFEADTWETNIPEIGASSSPVAVELNGDGVLDIVIGGGAREFTQTDAAVTAISGADGSILWKVPGRNQVVGSAITQDINADGTDDIFIGGRSAIFYAIDGSNGNVIWEFLPDSPNTDYVNDTTILNFFNPRWTPDVDDDGVKDILTAYGGFVKAPHGERNRPAGYLMVLSGKTGKTIAKAKMPDGRETYVSPLLHDFGRGPEVLFGTGGEDIDGSLWRVAFSDLLNNDLSQAKALLSGGEKGFIAPPVLADINEDGTHDIVVNTVDGRMVALDGKTDATLWSASPPGDYDTYVMPGPGYFTGNDNVPDFFTSFGRGAWPATDFTLQVLVDGKSGEIVSTDTLGTFQYASPVVADFTKDGKHDVLLSINYLITQDILGESTDFYANSLFVYNQGKGLPSKAFTTVLGSNLGSTPLLTDLDNDGNIDIITAYMTDERNFYSFKNLRLQRQEIKRKNDDVFFGGYMGKNGSSLVSQ